MASHVQSLKDQLKSARNNLSESSIRTYSSIIRTLFKKLEGDDDCDDYREYFRKNHKKTLEFLSSAEPSRRKTPLSALTVLCHEGQACDRYRAQMLDDSEKAREQLNSDEKTEKQKENWMDWEQIVSIHDQLGKEVAPLMTKASPTLADLTKIQDFVLLSLYVYQAPRRTEDYTLMRIRGGAKKKDDEDNYIDGKKFVFNKYKTSALSGSQRIDISPKMKTLLNKWVKLNNHEYLLVNHRTGSKLSASDVTKRLNGLFDKKISSSMLRHIFLSHVYDRKGMEQLARDMGHSVSEAVNVYAKK